MSDSQNLGAIGGFIALVGIVVLLAGVAMPTTSTHTSEACIDDPTGFGQECVSGSVTTPNPLRRPMIGIGFVSLIGGIGISLMSGSEASNQQIERASESVANGSFADKLRAQQGESDTTPTSDPRSESKREQSTRPLHGRVPDLVAYPVSFLLGAICSGLGFGILGALVGGGEGILFLIGVVVGAIWGVLAWYGLGKERLNLASISFTYLVVAVGGVFIMDGIIALFGIADTSLIGEVVFVLGVVGLLAGWHYTRAHYLPEYPTV